MHRVPEMVLKQFLVPSSWVKFLLFINSEWAVLVVMVVLLVQLVQMVLLVLVVLLVQAVLLTPRTASHG